MKRTLLFLAACFSTQLPAQTLTNAQVYDYQPGDIFQWTHADIYDMGFSCYYPTIYTYHTDSVLSKHYSTAGDTVFYSIHTSVYTPVGCAPSVPPTFSTSTNTVFYTDLNAVATHFSAISCLPVTDTFYTSAPYCFKNVWEIYTDLGNCFEQVDWKSTLIEGCGGPYVSYRGGYGGEPHYSNVLTFYKKNGIPCGTSTSVGVVEQAPGQSIQLYPNPGNGTMNIRYSVTGAAAQLTIYDISGHAISTYPLQPGTNNTLTINENGLSKGIYFYKLFVDAELKACDKIVIIN